MLVLLLALGAAADTASGAATTAAVTSSEWPAERRELNELDPAKTLPCMSPSLQRGDFHVVFSGVKPGTCFHKYVAAMGLTNARVIVYRRVEDHAPLASWKMRCGIMGTEHLLLPSTGGDAAAFYSYALEFYDKLPRLATFWLHAHGESPHMPCDTLFARARTWYSQAEAAGPMAERVISFDPKVLDGSAAVRRSSQHHRHRSLLADDYDRNVRDLLSKWNVTLPGGDMPLSSRPALKDGRLRSCCSTFMAPSRSIQARPQGLYKDLLRMMITATDEAAAVKAGFEDIIFDLLDSGAWDNSARDFYRSAGEAQEIIKSHAALQHCKDNTCP